MPAPARSFNGRGCCSLCFSPSRDAVVRVWSPFFTPPKTEGGPASSTGPEERRDERDEDRRHAGSRLTCLELRGLFAVACRVVGAPRRRRGPAVTVSSPSRNRHWHRPHRCPNARRRNRYTRRRRGRFYRHVLAGGTRTRATPNSGGACSRIAAPYLVDRPLKGGALTSKREPLLKKERAPWITSLRHCLEPPAVLETSEQVEVG